MLRNRYLDNSIVSFDRLLYINKNKVLSIIDRMTGKKFEDFIYWMFTKVGYKTYKTKPGPDQGGDLLIIQFETNTIAQIRRRNRKISNSAVQAVFSAKTFYNCNNAMVITNNYFTRNAKILAKKCNVSLWDRDKLIDYFEKNKLNIFKNL